MLFIAVTSLLHIAGAALEMSCAENLHSQTTVNWLDHEAKLSLPAILGHISPPDGRPGAIIAAKTRVAPMNYNYHWVRDAGLVMDALAGSYRTADATTRQELVRKFDEYVEFSKFLQTVPTLSGLGEPKFEVDGRAFNDPWGRPQDDSPALRVISLLHWSKVLAVEDSAKIGSRLFPIIQRDLDYLVDHWPQPSWDLWEEIKGTHFYTRMVQRRALLEGARLAEALDHRELAQAYERAGRAIERDLARFWDPSRDYILATLDRTAGLTDKGSQLDSAVILGVLHGYMNDGIFAPNDPRVLATLKHLRHAFHDKYPINQHADIPGVAFGRYPEDHYGGANFAGGNPWVLTTLMSAELMYQASTLERHAGRLIEAEALRHDALQQIARVRHHANPDGSLSEQIDRTTGYMTSVAELTWNYAAILTTAAARGANLNPR